MSSDKSEVSLIRFNGKNYSAWAFHFGIFVKGKEAWGHVDGSNPAPDKNKDKDQHAKWEVKDAQVMTWILGSVEPNIILNLRSSQTAAQIFTNLWGEYTDIVYADLPSEGLSSVQSVHETTQRDQFLMKLRPEFEGTRSNLMNRESVPSLDTCLNDLLREEQRLLTQTTMEQRRSASVPVAYAAQGKPRGRDMSTCCSSVTAVPLTQSAPVQPVTPDMIQQMIISAFSALGLSGSTVREDDREGPKVGRLFPLQFPLFSFSPFVSCNSAHVDYRAWHKRLGHPNSTVLHDLLKSGFLGNKESPSLSAVQFDCNSCRLGKSKTLPFPIHTPHVVQPFDLIHSDVWGMAPVTSHANYKYFVTFIDDYSRFTWIYFLHSKDEVFSVFKIFHAYIQTQFSAHIKILRSDNGDFLQTHGIISQRSCPSTPQQNGVAERKNRHLLDVVRTLLLESSTPFVFGVKLSPLLSISSTGCLLPHCTTTLLSPSYLVALHLIPTFVHLVVSVMFIFLHMNTKLMAQSIQCAFLGYSVHQKAPVLNISSPAPVPSQPLFVYQRRSSKLPINLQHLPSPLQLLPRLLLLFQQLHLPPQTEYSVRRPPDRFGSSPLSLFTATLSSISLPSSYTQAMKHECWRTAVETELLALEENQTWDVVPCPSSVKPLGNKFVFSVKLRSDGSIDRYKARLVALGNKQEYGLDYDETFAPVAKMTTVRTILALAASQSWPLHQMDVKNAFLHSQYDSSLFLQRTSMGIVVLLVYVDDIVITGSDLGAISAVQTLLHSTFHMKDLGPSSTSWSLLASAQIQSRSGSVSRPHQHYFR
ncbi:hypothetical protein Prudu_1222S000100, partial [Prunus dulcis]